MDVIKREYTFKRTDRNPLVVPCVNTKVCDVSKQIAPPSPSGKPRIAHVKMVATVQNTQRGKCVLLSDFCPPKIGTTRTFIVTYLWCTALGACARL